MNQVLQTYNINEQTQAIMPANHTDYHSIVLETSGEYCVKQRPQEIISHGCLARGSSYDGRREAVIYLTESKKKVPIPIDPYEPIYAFPTHSPQLYNCIWLFYQHIQTISPSSNKKETCIAFSNGRSIHIPVSYYSIQNQLNRTAYCLFRFSSFLYGNRFNPRGSDETKGD